MVLSSGIALKRVNLPLRFGGGVLGLACGLWLVVIGTVPASGQECLAAIPPDGGYSFQKISTFDTHGFLKDCLALGLSQEAYQLTSRSIWDHQGFQGEELGLGYRLDQYLLSSLTNGSREQGGFAREELGILFGDETQTQSYSSVTVFVPSGFLEERLQARWRTAPFILEGRITMGNSGFKGGVANLQYAPSNSLTLGGTAELGSETWRAQAEVGLEMKPFAIHSLALFDRQSHGPQNRIGFRQAQLRLGWQSEGLDAWSETTVDLVEPLLEELGLNLRFSQLTFSGSAAWHLLTRAQPVAAGAGAGLGSQLSPTDAEGGSPSYTAQLQEVRVGIRVALPPLRTPQLEAHQPQPPTARIFGPRTAHVLPDQLIELNALGSTDPDGQIVHYEWDLGDGSRAAGRTVQHRYRLPGRYIVLLTVTDNDSLKSQDAITLFVEIIITQPQNKPPVADAGGPYRGQVDEPITFDGRHSTDPDGQIMGYHWDFGDGAMGSSPVVSHIYREPGNYRVTLTVTDDKNASSTATTTAEIIPLPVEPKPPVADFVYRPAAPTTQDQIQFLDQSSDSDGMVISWRWDFGDGTYSSQPNPRHQYQSPGVYRVRLTVADNDGLSASVIKALTVKPPELENQPPKAGFRFEPVQPTTDDLVRFIDQSSDPDGRIVGWLWQLGDGATSTEQNPTHRYPKEGSYTVTLTVTDDKGAQGTANQTLQVGPSLPPLQADFTWQPVKPSILDLVQFIDRSSGLPTSWQWDFGDGSSSLEQNPRHQYRRKGVFQVTLAVTDKQGSSAVTRKTLFVINLPPVADPSGPYQEVVGDQLVFNGGRSYDRDSKIVQYEWDFGDGATGTGVRAIHVYQKPGEYTICLTVTDEEGARGRACTQAFIQLRGPG